MNVHASCSGCGKPLGDVPAEAVGRAYCSTGCARRHLKGTR